MARTRRRGKVARKSRVQTRRNNAMKPRVQSRRNNAVKKSVRRKRPRRSRGKMKGGDEVAVRKILVALDNVTVESISSTEGIINNHISYKTVLGSIGRLGCGPVKIDETAELCKVSQRHEDILNTLIHHYLKQEDKVGNLTQEGTEQRNLVKNAAHKLFQITLLLRHSNFRSEIYTKILTGTPRWKTHLHWLLPSETSGEDLATDLTIIKEHAGTL